MHDVTIFNHCGCMYYHNANERSIVNYIWVELVVELHKVDAWIVIKHARPNLTIVWISLLYILSCNNVYSNCLQYPI